MSVSSSDYEEMVLLPPSYHETPPSYVETSETVETSFLEQNNISNTQGNIHLMSYLPQVRTSLSSGNDELLSSPPSYHEAPPVETTETPLIDQNVSNTNNTQMNPNQQSNIPQRHCQTCKQRIITRIMVLKCLCIFCILAWIFVYF
uniref:Uncharacterized protein n=1 Tax=Meloidogyne enterolobii TaxID=390850 RepID=A0A6V7VUL2_MELEN|nr:unnamed protein product [Meloidogyne enterolobii]